MPPLGRLDRGRKGGIKMLREKVPFGRSKITRSLPEVGIQRYGIPTERWHRFFGVERGERGEKCRRYQSVGAVWGFHGIGRMVLSSGFFAPILRALPAEISWQVT